MHWQQLTAWLLLCTGSSWQLDYCYALAAVDSLTTAMHWQQLTAWLLQCTCSSWQLDYCYALAAVDSLTTAKHWQLLAAWLPLCTGTICQLNGSYALAAIGSFTAAINWQNFSAFQLYFYWVQAAVGSLTAANHWQQLAVYLLYALAAPASLTAHVVCQYQPDWLLLRTGSNGQHVSCWKSGCSWNLTNAKQWQQLASSQLPWIGSSWQLAYGHALALVGSLTLLKNCSTAYCFLLLAV
jgi:hypothetical protein